MECVPLVTLITAGDKLLELLIVRLLVPVLSSSV